VTSFTFCSDFDELCEEEEDDVDETVDGGGEPFDIEEDDDDEVVDRRVTSLFVGDDEVGDCCSI